MTEVASSSISPARENDVAHRPRLSSVADGRWSHTSRRREGRRIQVNGRTLYDFASCSYLGLERRPELARAASEAAHRYGTQLSMSRALHECALWQELESKLEVIADRPVLLAPSMPVMHRAALSALVRDRDAVVIDHFAHASLHDAAASLRAVPVRRVRHSHMDRLEEALEQLAPEHELVWLIVDGLYPMFGDFAPFLELAGLLRRWPQLRFYVDDSHAAGWLGAHGRGGALSALDHRGEVFVAFSLNKSFAAAGAALAFPDASLKMRVRRCGGPMLFSGSIQPPMLGAAVASADLHLGEDHPRMQVELMSRIDYALALAKDVGLPLVTQHRTPIFFVPCDSMDAMTEQVKKLLASGFCVCPSGFPAPMSSYGIRFTITRHSEAEDIEGLVAATMTGRRTA